MNFENKQLVERAVKDIFNDDIYDDVLNIVWKYYKNIHLTKVDVFNIELKNVLCDDILNIIWGYHQSICLTDIDALNYKLKKIWDNERITKFNEWLAMARYINLSIIKIDTIEIGKQGLIFKGFFLNNELDENDFEAFTLIAETVEQKDSDNE